MTINDAIRHFEIEAGKIENNLEFYSYSEWKQRISENKQIAEWLRELKKWRGRPNNDKYVGDLDFEIKSFHDIGWMNEQNGNRCAAEEYYQIEEWLKELKERRDKDRCEPQDDYINKPKDASKDIKRVAKYMAEKLISIKQNGG